MWCAGRSEYSARFTTPAQPANARPPTYPPSHPGSPMLLLTLLGCPPEPEPAWYLGCGDPACSGYGGPFDGVPLCDPEVAGDPCTPAGASCDPVDDCNALLVCATEDPRSQDGGCPISLARHKRDIRYLDAEALVATAAAAGDVRLATWNYRWEPPGTPPHLGFLIDDQVPGPAVAADGQRVDLYGHTSLAIAGVQAQQARTAALEAQVQALADRVEAQEHELARLRADRAATR